MGESYRCDACDWEAESVRGLEMHRAVRHGADPGERPEATAAPQPTSFWVEGEPGLVRNWPPAAEAQLASMVRGLELQVQQQQQDLTDARDRLHVLESMMCEQRGTPALTVTSASHTHAFTRDTWTPPGWARVPARAGRLILPPDHA